MNTPLVMDVIGAEDWPARVRQIYSEGFTFFDFLTVIERESDKRNSATQAPILEVVVRVTEPDFGKSQALSTQVPVSDPRLASITEIYPGADWHERECAEMFGIEFVGNRAQTLLRHENVGAPPLRKSVVLSTRVIVEWPGAAEPEIQDDGRKVGNASRRRQRPPGVPESWLQT